MSCCDFLKANVHDQVATEGDAFTLAFHDPVDAVAWAVSIQQVRQVQTACLHGCSWHACRSLMDCCNGLIAMTALYSGVRLKAGHLQTASKDARASLALLMKLRRKMWMHGAWTFYNGHCSKMLVWEGA